MMNPYQHKRIKTDKDRRLVDLFLHQNPANRWLTIEDVACWVNETNKPSQDQQNTCSTNCFSILGMSGTSEVKQAFLEQSVIEAKGERVFAFRLKEIEIQAPVSKVIVMSVEGRMNDVLDQARVKAEAKAEQEQRVAEIVKQHAEYVELLDLIDEF